MLLRHQRSRRSEVDAVEVRTDQLAGRVQTLLDEIADHLDQLKEGGNGGAAAHS